MARKKAKRKSSGKGSKASRIPPMSAVTSGAAGAKAAASGALSVCLLSPHPFVLENLRTLLDRPKFRVQVEHVEFLPGQGGALPGLPAAQVFVLDANGPLRAVVALISRVRSEQPGARVVVVSEELAEEIAFPLMRLGIRGLVRYADAATPAARS